MKRKITILVPAFFLLSILLIYFFVRFFIFNNAELKSAITVVVPKYSSGREVGEILYQKGLIRNPLIFRLYTRLKRVDGQLKAGVYTFKSTLSLPEIVDQLVEGRPDIVKVTIPEGYTVGQIAEIFAEKEIVHRDSFLEEAGQGDFNYSFLEGLPIGPRRLEGYLFPDTYYLYKGISSHQIIDLMLKRFHYEIESLNYGQLVSHTGLTLREALIIASLVEKEAKVDQERPLIAGIILKRLRAKIPLQIDATIQYALGNHRPVLYYKDLEVESPYNTYKIVGLPPSPIACPGRSSLLAVAHPENTDYLYYVAKPDGTHAFSKTLEEHNINKKKYQQS